MADDKKEHKKVAVFGSGSFGTAMAFAVAANGHDVVIVARSEEAAESINKTHQNLKYLRDFVLPDNITATTSLSDALSGVSLIIHAIPMQASLDYLEHHKDFIPKDVPIVSVSKGIHSERLILMNEVFEEVLGKEQPTAYLSGPSFAKEILQKTLTSVVIASDKQEVATFVQEMFSSPFFRVYTTDDVRGVEIGGALKNVFAIGAGAVAGLGYGNNSVAALVTRGCHELRQVATRIGARPETLSGLSGIGDLMLTCFGSLSRNRTVGFRLGQGETLEHILETSLEVAEGIPTTTAALKLLQKHELSLPLMTAIAGVVEGRLDAKEAVTKLMSLPAGHEEDHSPILKF